MVDIDRLRDELSDYYGSAAFAGHPAAFFDLEQVQAAPDDALPEMAREAGIDFDND